LRVVHLNTQAQRGGAAIAARRIHGSLTRAGVDSHLLAQFGAADDHRTHLPTGKLGKALALLRDTLEPLPLAFYRHRSGPMSLNWVPSRISSRVAEFAADLVNLHWVAAGMMPIRSLRRLDCPVVWTLHDMWAFTGGCFYAGNCKGYTDTCGRCPLLRSGFSFDASRLVMSRKTRAWRKLEMVAVAPSRWLADCARLSPIMRDRQVAVIPNPLDTDAWAPIDKRLARSLLGLPVEEPVVAFGAIGGSRDPRKGFELLLQALTHLRGQIQGLRLLVFGQRPTEDPPDLGVPVHYTGHLHDDLSLRVLYSAADLLVNPSRYEAFGQTASEAHACGTPVVAFDNSGLRDIIEHRQTGYLAHAFDTEDLAQGIEWVLERCVIGGAPAAATGTAPLGANARRRAMDLFSYPVVAGQYLQLYRRMLDAA
jgi:glycosyltransferase involved in cell wall biosynthesis